MTGTARATSIDTPVTEVQLPDLVRIQQGTIDAWRPVVGSGVSVVLTPTGRGLSVEAATNATNDRISRIHLRWRRPCPPGALILGDAWERTYGDQQWTGLRPERVLPWMVLVHDPAAETTWGAGVEVRGGAFASWTVDPEGVSLWLDLRSGGRPVRLRSRTLSAAVVRFVAAAASPFAVQGMLAGVLCRDPLPTGPLVGANNWYYAYGKGFDAAAVLRDARTISELVGDHPVRPFAVVDDGWSVDGTADGRRASAGPWDQSRPQEFPDMGQLAADIASEGVRPGIWFRPLLARHPDTPGILRPWEGAYALDPSHPATLETVAGDVRRIREWGFELIKHDFSTFDALGRWGFQMGARPAADDIEPFDQTRTTAEVLVDLYRVVHEAAGTGVVIGCNVVGHLAAGLVQAQRTGDDTSGRVWERSRRMGVNTLAFRLAQHRRFFTVDADCVASTPQTDWGQNRQFLDLVARSGTALFVSIDPRTRSNTVDADLAAALRLALDGGSGQPLEPLDWLWTTAPQQWRSGSDVLDYRWFDDTGADPFDLTDAGDFVD